MSWVDKTRYLVVVIVIVLVGLVGCEDPDDDTPTGLQGVIAHWMFDEDTGTILRDASGNNLNGVITNATWIEGSSGSALQFDYNPQSDDRTYVTVPYNQLLQPTTAITIEAIVRFSTPLYYVGEAAIVATNENGGYGLWVYNGTPNLYINIDSTYYSAVDEDTDYDTDSWYHIAGVYDGEAVKFYVNGELIDTTPASGSITYNWENALQIGADADTLNEPEPPYFSGEIDEIRITNRALSASDFLSVTTQDTSTSLGVSLVTPDSYTISSDYITLEAEISGSSTIEKVEFYIDGELAYTDNASPWEYEWDTSTYENGSEHSVQVKAYTSDGQLVSSDTSLFVVERGGLIGTWYLSNLFWEATYTTADDDLLPYGIPSGTNFGTGMLDWIIFNSMGVGATVNINGDNTYTITGNLPIENDTLGVSPTIVQLTDAGTWVAGSNLSTIVFDGAFYDFGGMLTMDDNEYPSEFSISSSTTITKEMVIPITGAGIFLDATINESMMVIMGFMK